MTIPHTDRVQLPLLAAGQTQKELVHNEALLLLDLLCQPVVQSADLAAPPATPEPGACWIVAAAATGDWSGYDHALAGWTANGWRFSSPQPGWRTWVMDRQGMMRFESGAWVDEEARHDGYFVAGARVLAGRQSAIGAPAGGAMVDAEARAAIAAILTALRAHGLIAV